MADTEKIILEIQTSSEKVTELRSAINELRTARKRLLKDEKANKEAIKQLDLEINEHNENLKKNRRNLALSTKEFLSQTKSIEELRNKTNRLVSSRDKLDQSTTQGRKLFKQYTKEIAKNNKQLSKYDEQIRRFSRNVGNYSTALNGLTGAMGITIGAVGVIQGMRKVIDLSKDLDDQLADVRKTTNLTNKEVRELHKSLSLLNTRTSMAGLLGIAEAAGRMGVAKDEILDFVREVDRAYIALGDTLEGSAEEIATQLSKISEQFGLEQEFGVAEGVNRFGSVLNELGATTKAQEGAILDFTNRLVGLSRSFNLNITDITALGALFDQTGQEMSVSGTSISQVLLKMGQETETFAEIAGVSVEEFERLYKEDAIDALIVLSEGVRKASKNNLDLAKTFSEMQLEGKKVVGTLGTLANNTETFAKFQDISNKALKEGTSLLDEFNKKNTTLAASFEKLNKAWELALTTGEESNNFIKTVIDTIKDATIQISNLDLITTRTSKLTEEQVSRTFDVLKLMSSERARFFQEFLAEREKQTLKEISIERDKNLKILQENGFSEQESLLLFNEFQQRKLDQEIKFNKADKKRREEEEAERLQREKDEQEESIRLATEAKKLRDALYEDEEELPIESWMMNALETQKEGQDLSMKRLEDFLNSMGKAWDEYYGWTEKRAKDSKEIKDRLNDLTLKSTADLLGTLAGLLKENTLAYKVLASGEALINTYLAVTAALSQPESGYAAYIDAAARLASGLAAVAEINGITFAKGGILEGASHANGGIQLFGKSGSYYGEAEGGEPILTKGVSQNPYLLKAASDINVAGGGKPFFQNGGLTATTAQRVVNNTINRNENIVQPVLVVSDVTDLQLIERSLQVAVID